MIKASLSSLQFTSTGYSGVISLYDKQQAKVKLFDEKKLKALKLKELEYRKEQEKKEAEKEKEIAERKIEIEKQNQTEQLNTVQKQQTPVQPSRHSSSYRLEVCNESTGTRINHINNALSDTRLAGYGSEIVQLGQEYNLSPYFITAVALQETSGGKYTVGTDNIFNIKSTSGGWKCYGSKSQSLNDFCNLITRYYLDKGLETVDQIGNVYCQGGAWSTPIKEIMNSLI